MYLLPALQLQAVFYHTQEFIGLPQLMEVMTVEVAAVIQLLQGKQRAACMQPALFATVYALQALHQEFDVTDTPAVQLDVHRAGLVAQRDGAAAMGIDLVARIDRRLNCAEIDVRRIDARPHSADEV